MRFPQGLQNNLIKALRWSERYTKTDMVYLASGNFWLTGGRVLSVGTGMILTVAFANLVSPDVFGTYKYVLATAGLVGVFSLNGMNGTVQRFIAQGKKHVVPALFRITILSGIPASLAIAVAAGYYFVQGNATLGWSFLFIALTNPLLNGFALGKSILQGTGDFKGLTIWSVPRTALSVALLVATLLLTKNVVIILFVYFASNFAIGLLGYRWAMRRTDIQPSERDVPEALRFGWHMSLLGFFGAGVGYLDQLLLWHFTDPATLVVYTLALKPIQEVNNFFNNFTTMGFLKMAAKSRHDAYRALPFRLFQLFGASVAAMCLYVILVPILFWILFPQYTSAIVVSQVLALTIILQPRALVEQLFFAHGETRKRTISTVTSQMARLALVFFLIPVYGLWGAVYAYIASEFFAAVITLLTFRLAPRTP